MAIIGGAVLAGLGSDGLLTSLGLRSASAPGAGTYVLDRATRGPFVISLNVQGHLDSRRNATLSCQVEGSTTIISLVPEGTRVKTGDVVCELDASALTEKAKQQEITVTQADAALAQSRESLEIQKTQNESDIAAAELKWKLALLDLDKYEQGEYPQQQKQLSGNVALNEEELLRAQENMDFVKEQVRKGYRTQNDLEAARIAVKQAELKLEGSKEELKVLTEFSFRRTIEELKANAKELERELARVKLKAKSAVTQFEKDVEARDLTASVERERHERFVKQIQACTLRAPQDGEVVYANLSSNSRRGGSDSAAIEEGATVRERQAIINLPDVTQMKVDCRIHESLIGSIRKGLRARIRVDAYPDEIFMGEIATVSSVPMSGSWPNMDLREYATEIVLTESIEKVQRLRPGLTTQVEILVDSRENVLQIPVQAVVGVADKQMVFVLQGRQPQRRDVKVGASNQSHIEILDGVDEGEMVIQNPRSRFAEEIAQLEAKLNTARNEQAAQEATSLEPVPAASPSDTPTPAAEGQGAPRGPGGDPAAFFARIDQNNDGKLTVDEVPERMKERFSSLDADSNGEVTLDEFKKGMANSPGGAGGPPPRAN